MRTRMTAIAALAIALASSTAHGVGIQITEWQYDGSEFVELTNFGPNPIDMTGWSYDDDSITPDTTSLSSFGVVAVGESVILTDVTDAAFRTEWNLPNSVKVIGGNLANLSRNDIINVFDDLDQLVDRLAYGDQNFPGTIRTNTKSGVPMNSSALGANNPALWKFSALLDEYSSVTSVGGFIGSPGFYPIPEPTGLGLFAVAMAVGVIARRRFRQG
jgi:predicted extracellular nuclease